MRAKFLALLFLVLQCIVKHYFKNIEKINKLNGSILQPKIILIALSGRRWTTEQVSTSLNSKPVYWK